MAELKVNDGYVLLQKLGQDSSGIITRRQGGVDEFIVVQSEKQEEVGYHCFSNLQNVQVMDVDGVEYYAVKRGDILLFKI
jgi:hypothetical protein